MSDPTSSWPEEIFEQAIALEPQVLRNVATSAELSAATATQRVARSGGESSLTTSAAPASGMKRPLEDSENPYTAARRRYILSPDSSEVSPSHPQHAPFPSSPTSPTSRIAPASPRFRRLHVSDTTTSVSFLGSDIRAGPIDGAQSYLAGDEYRPTAYGDIGDYMRKKDVKVQTQNAQLAFSAAAEGIPQIFTGLSFYINGNTSPPMEVLRKLIVQRGGIVQPYLRTKNNVDYVIAPVLTVKKYNDLAKGGRLRMVREGFVTQSVDEAKIVDWRKWRITPAGDGAEGGLQGFMTSQRPKTGSSKEEEAEKVDEGTGETPARPPPVASSSRLPMVPAPKIVTSRLLPAASRSNALPVAARRNLLPPTSQARFQSQRSVHGQPPPMSSLSANRAASPKLASPAAPARELRPTIPVTEVPRRVTNGMQLQQSSSTPSVGAASAAVGPRTAPSSSQTDFGDLIDLTEVDIPELDGLVDGSSKPGDVEKTDDIPGPEVQAEGTRALPEVVEIETTDPDPNRPPTRPEGAWENYAVHKSNPHASRLMQTEGFREQKTAVQGTAFIDSFYQNSRLHLLSTWKAALKLLVAEARSMAGHVPRVLPPASADRVIFHVDFDAFFVSAGLASRPELVGKPVVVCHSSGGGRDSTSEIASASYEARALGVRNGMSLGRARQLVGAELETIPYEFETYKSHSTAFYAVLLAYADELEAVSIDEAILDLTGAVTACALAPDAAGDDSDPAVTVAARVRADIKEKTGCNVSIGIAHNILLARLATRAAKPPGTGIHHLHKADVADFLAEMDVDSFPSFGHSAKRKLESAFGSTKAADLTKHSKDALRKVLGPKTGDTLYNFLRGRDDRKLEPDKARKSVSAEINYAIRFQDQKEADTYLMNLAGEVGKRLRAIDAKGRHLTLKIMARDKDAPVEPPKFLGHGRCETFNKSNSLPRHTDDAKVIGDECIRLLKAMRLDPVELRGIGIQVTKLEFGVGAKGMAGQSTISFAKKGAEDRSKFFKATEAERDEGPADDPVPLDALVPTAPSSPALPENRSGAHASSEMDPDFLAAIPPELLADAKAEYMALRAARHRSLQPSPPPAIDPPTAGPSTVMSRNPAAHITKQLRPKLKTQLKAGEISQLPLYSAWNRAGDRATSRSRSVSVVPEGAEVIDLEEDDEIGGHKRSTLKALGIDPEVFAALPPDVQAEAIASRPPARSTAIRGGKINGGRRGRGRTTTTSPKPNRAATPMAVQIKKPALFGERETGKVAGVLAAWVHSGAPENKDVDRVRAYLLKCLRGFSGIEHVSTLLRSMRAVLDEGDAGQAWLDAWGVLYAAVDEDVRERMGAGLRL